MAAQRIRAANASGLPRCKSEGALIDLSEGLSESSFSDVKGEPPGTALAEGEDAACQRPRPGDSPAARLPGFAFR